MALSAPGILRAAISAASVSSRPKWCVMMGTKASQFHEKDAGQSATGTNTTPAMSGALGLKLFHLIHCPSCPVRGQDRPLLQVDGLDGTQFIPDEYVGMRPEIIGVIP